MAPTIHSKKTKRPAKPRRLKPRAPRGETEAAYTSREAAEVSGVPFFTIDYWGRTKFLVPTVAKGQGRGRGRQRMYSYGDLIRLRIARELRDQQVSLETLRHVVAKLARHTERLSATRFVLIGSAVETAASVAELLAVLRRPGRRTFGVILDLRELLKIVRAKARSIQSARPR